MTEYTAASLRHLVRTTRLAALFLFRTLAVDARASLVQQHMREGLRKGIASSNALDAIADQLAILINGGQKDVGAAGSAVAGPGSSSMSTEAAAARECIETVLALSSS